MSSVNDADLSPEPAPQTEDVSQKEATPDHYDPALAGDSVLANPVLRGILMALGWVAVAFGAIGVVVPGWPTTVWLLVAAYFFARSSPRFLRWLLNHRVFGPFVRDIRAGLGISARAKTYAISMIVLFAGGSSIGVGLVRPWIGVIIAVTGAVGIAYILRMPTRMRTP